MQCVLPSASADDPQSTPHAHPCLFMYSRLNNAAREGFVASATSTSRFPSLLNLLGPSCSTKRGRQCLKQWLEQPCVDAVTLKERLDTVDAVVSAVSGGSLVLWRLSSLFQQFQSYERDLSLFVSSAGDNSTDAKLSVSDFNGLQRWLSELQVIAEACFAEEECATGIDNLFSSRLRPIRLLVSRDLQSFCKLVREVIASMDRDVEGAPFTMEDNSESNMRSSTSHLQELHRQIRQCEQEVKVAAKQAAILLSIADDRIKVIYADDEQSNIAKIGIVLRVARQDSHRIQQQSGKAVSVIRASRASGVWFSTPTIDALGATWASLKRSFEDAEAGLVEFLTSEFRSHFQAFLDELALRVAELDVLVSFALVSHKHNFVRASIQDMLTDDMDQGAVLEVDGIFDPFMQNASTTATQDVVESCSDVTIKLSVHDGKTFLLLTGDQNSTDMGLLQLLGIVVMLNQLGCFVPCLEAVLPVFDAIYLRTGAYDQQLYGYSTFMTEMREMSHTFSVMTPNSLVLIEDLCRGTSTSEGLALALSMCLHLMELKTLTCFSSEWRELTVHLAEQLATATPFRGHPDRNIDSRPGHNVRDSSRVLAEFEKQMRHCDLPSDLIARISEEMQQTNTK